MTLSLDDVRNKRFRMARKSGYEVLEVDEFVALLQFRHDMLKELSGGATVMAMEQDMPALKAIDDRSGDGSASYLIDASEERASLFPEIPLDVGPPLDTIRGAAFW